jgi:hypothetical protein
MAKVIGIIEMRPRPGFPTLKGSDGDEVLAMQYTCSEDELTAIPEYGDNFTDSRYPFFTALTSHVLDKRNITRDKSGELYTLELEYRSPAGDANSPSGPVMEEWDYETQDYDVPIEQHPNYRTCWNYRFIVIKGETPDPELHSAATDTELTEGEAEKYAWIRLGDKVPVGWYEWGSPQKKAVESYRAGITTVNRIWRCSNLKKLTVDINKDYTISAPDKTFGKTGEWLRGGSKIKKEGRMWVLTVSYLNIKEIDRDIYQ